MLLALYPHIYPKMSKSSRIQLDLTIPSTSSAPQLTKLQNSDDVCQKHDHHLGDTEQYVNYEPIVDATTTVHEVDRIVIGSWDPKFGHLS